MREACKDPRGLRRHHVTRPVAPCSKTKSFPENKTPLGNTLLAMQTAPHVQQVRAHLVQFFWTFHQQQVIVAGPVASVIGPGQPLYLLTGVTSGS